MIVQNCCCFRSSITKKRLVFIVHEMIHQFRSHKTVVQIFQFRFMMVFFLWRTNQEVFLFKWSPRAPYKSQVPKSCQNSNWPNKIPSVSQTKLHQIPLDRDTGARDWRTLSQSNYEFKSHVDSAHF